MSVFSGERGTAMRREAIILHGARVMGAIISLAVVLVLAAASFAQADTIKLRADLWCPYNCDPESDKPGLLIEVARAILTPAGHSIDYRTMPWSRALSEVRKGRIHGVIGAQQSEAPDLVYGRIPIAFDDTGFVVKQGVDFRYGGAASLDPYRIAVISDYNYDGGEIDAYLKENAAAKDRIQFNSGDDVGIANLRKLIAGRVDVVIDSFTVMSYLIQKYNLSDKVYVVQLGRPTEIFIAFSPSDSRSNLWSELLSAGIAPLRQRGELGVILARYGLKDWQKP
ncbi:Transporter substrate-binding domain-containing protein [Azospirillaceae bacterium]